MKKIPFRRVVKRELREIEDELGLKRVLLSLPPDLYELISSIARRVGTTRAGMIRDLLEEQRQTLKAMKKALDKAVGSDEEDGISLVRAMAARAEQDQLEKVLESILPAGRRRVSKRGQR